FSENQDETFILAVNGRVKVTELDQVLRTRSQTRPEPIELLVLSACQTAKGDERAALGLAGVAVRAGARSTVASLWSVYDEIGAPLMVEFYRQLITTPTLSKAEALRQAQLTVLRRPDTSHPLNWAPFVLVGNWL
ncbi:MAG TPA: CHAT domain-containing protein, partial [Allocoleopsis sp.]